jgi:hypothetical protein
MYERDGCLYTVTQAQFVRERCRELTREARALETRVKCIEGDMARLKREVEFNATAGNTYVARRKAEQIVYARREYACAGEDLRHVRQFLALFRAQGSASTLDRGLVGLTRVMEVRSRSLSPAVYGMLVQAHRELGKSLTRQGPTIAFYDDRPADSARSERDEAIGLNEDVRSVFAELHLESLLPPPTTEPRSVSVYTPPASAPAVVPSLGMTLDGSCVECRGEEHEDDADAEKEGIVLETIEESLNRRLTRLKQ